MSYDLVIAGGGVAGAALATVMSRARARVLVVERERTFRDRVRGEGMHPWGVAEAARLQLDQLLLARCARPAREWCVHLGPDTNRRDLIETTPSRMPGFNVHHPELQETLLRAAAEAGAEVVREARIEQVTAGERPGCRITGGDGSRAVEARLIALADGRSSPLRTQLGFELFETPSPLRVSGLLFEGVPELADAVDVFFGSSFGRLALVFPLSRERARVYFVEHRDLPPAQLRGAQGVAELVAQVCALGVPRAWVEHARAAGPLASFDSHCAGAIHPARDGVVLLGDAAGHVDPAFGAGLSLAMRDVRVLSEALLAETDWLAAAQRYALTRSEYYRALLRLEGWMTRVLYGIAPEDDALRARAFPRLNELGIDLVGAGPDSRSDDAVRAVLFG